MNQLTQEECKKTAEAYQNTIEPAHLVLCGDFGWGHRCNAKEGVYGLIDAHMHKVVYQVVFIKKKMLLQNGQKVVVQEGNYDGTSKGMEGEGFRQIIDWLAENKLLPLLKTFVCDQDSSVLCTLRTDPRLAHVRVAHDPGHTKKNFMKDLTKIFGTGKEATSLVKRMGRWFMRALKEAKEKVNQEGKMTFEERERRLIAEFTRRMQHAISHYFSPLCQDDCPCCTAEICIMPSSSTYQPTSSSSLLSLPDELLLHIMSFVPRSKDDVSLLQPHKYFFSLASTCTRLYVLSKDPTFHHHRAFRLARKQHLRISSPNDPLLPQVKEAKAIILSLTSRAASFVHDYNTCLNESFNSSRTKDVPKHRSFPSTYSSRCCFSLLRQNLGPGGALCAIWRALGLQVSAPLQHHAQLEDKRREKDRKRKSSKEFHKRERELQRQEIQQKERERKKSKRKGDEYLDWHQKTTQPPWDSLPTMSAPTSASASGSSSRFSSLTPAMVPSLSGAALDAALRQCGLPLCYKKDRSANMKRQRLREYLEHTTTTVAPTSMAVAVVAGAGTVGPGAVAAASVVGTAGAAVGMAIVPAPHLCQPMGPTAVEVMTTTTLASSADITTAPAANSTRPNFDSEPRGKSPPPQQVH